MTLKAVCSQLFNHTHSACINQGTTYQTILDMSETNRMFDERFDRVRELVSLYSQCSEFVEANEMGKKISIFKMNSFLIQLDLIIEVDRAEDREILNVTIHHNQPLRGRPW